MKRNISSKVVLALFALFVVAFPAAAEEGQVNLSQIADVSINPTAITFQPKVEYKSLLLKIATPTGAVLEQSFSGSSAPYFDIAMAGGPLVDGLYGYELVVTPHQKLSQQGIEGGRSESNGFSANPLGAAAPEAPALTQSGNFTIKNGSLVTSSNEGLSSTMDIVHNDDVIITFSLCVGNDCVNGENFGFDTLRLKENNLRLHFDDTSTSASFPKNDWRIVANDSANGGASYLAFEDSTAGRQVFRVDAGAPANSLRVDSSGDVSIGNSNAVVELHITDGDSPTLRLEQDGSSGFTPQTWDVAGNETNFFVRDVTNGSNLPFKIKPGADDNTLVLDNDNYVGIGILNATSKLHINAGNASTALHIATDSSTPALLTAERASGATVQLSAGAGSTFFGSRSNHPMNLIVNQNSWFYMDTSGNISLAQNASTTNGNKIDTGIAGSFLTSGGVWTSASSRAVKENISGLTTQEAIDALQTLDPVKFNYIAEKGEQYVGFIAEDVPELVATNSRKSLNAMDVVAVLTKVVKEQQKVAAQQQKTIAEMKQEIKDLKKKLDK
jgi:hypothetical protein